MELLIGVYHDQKTLDGVESLLRRRYPASLDSVMLEIPSDFDVLKSIYKTVYQIDWGRGGYFTALADRFRATGSNIIYGDVPMGVLSKEQLQEIFIRQLFGAIRRYLTTTDDKYMIKRMEKTNPRVTIVGRTHADRLKKRFPNLYYIAHSPTNRILKLLFDDTLPNEIISVNVGLDSIT